MQLSIFDYLEEDKPKEKVKRYTNREYREYIKSRYDKENMYHNEKFYNIIISKNYCDGDFDFSKKPEEEYMSFIDIYKSFQYHFYCEEIQIFSYRDKFNDTDTFYRYHLCIQVKNDYIVELARVNDLWEETLCAPACAIYWYDSNGKQIYGEYLTYKENELNEWRAYLGVTKEIKIPTVNDEFMKDRREYYFYKKLELHKYAEPRDDGNMWFCNMKWYLSDMITYFRNKYNTAEYETETKE